MGKLTSKDRAALRWAAEKADEWYGNVTGDRELEQDHLRKMDSLRDALDKLGISIVIRRG